MTRNLSTLPTPTDTRGLPVVRWQVRLDSASASKALRMAEAAGVTLQAVLLGAIRYHAESVLGAPVAGYLTPLRPNARYCLAEAAAGRRPRIRIPRWWVADVIPAVSAATNGSSPTFIVREAVAALWDATAGDGERIRENITPIRRVDADEHTEAA